MLDEQGREVRRYFLEEFIPNGRIVAFDENGCLARVWEDPRIKETEAYVGPNRLFAMLREIGVPVNKLVMVGGGFGVDSICYESLTECAEAIAQALDEDQRYRHFRELTAQERVRVAREESAMSYAYWAEEAAVSEEAWAREEGLFKGCYTMLGRPLSDESKQAILAYLNDPTLERWLEIRGLIIAGVTTLWQAWCQLDPDAPRSGSERQPSPETLRTAIRTAVLKRREEIEERRREGTRPGSKSSMEREDRLPRRPVSTVSDTSLSTHRPDAFRPVFLRPRNGAATQAKILENERSREFHLLHIAAAVQNGMKMQYRLFFGSGTQFSEHSSLRCTCCIAGGNTPQAVSGLGVHAWKSGGRVSGLHSLSASTLPFVVDLQNTFVGWIPELSLTIHITLRVCVVNPQPLVGNHSPTTGSPVPPVHSPGAVSQTPLKTRPRPLRTAKRCSLPRYDVSGCA